MSLVELPIGGFALAGHLAAGHGFDIHRNTPGAVAHEHAVRRSERAAGRERRDSGRAAHDRRQKSEPRVAGEPEFRKGWLAFQSGVDWRRVAPIPEAWESMSDRELLALLDRADLTSAPRPAR